jgi:four helix bundle protein
MRDHTKLTAFELADELAILVYEATRSFPKDEQFGLTSQVRRAAVSVPSNIVEGCAHHTLRQYVRFLEIAFASLRELEYQLSLAHRIGYMPEETYDPIAEKCTRASKVLGSLVRSLRNKPKDPSPKSPKA